MNYAKIVVLIAMILVATSFVSAQNVEVTSVHVNDVELPLANPGDFASNELVNRGEDLDLKIRLKAIADAENVQVEADIYGYKYGYEEEDKVSDVSRTFDMDLNDTDSIELNLQVPINMDRDYFLLRIRVSDQNSLSSEYVYQLHVKGVEYKDAVIVKDYSFNPSSIINAGRAFTAMVRLQNIGEELIDDVSVKVAIPELNVQDTENLEELDVDEKETLEEFLLRIPDCAEPGVYDVEISVEFNEYYTTQETTQITVLSGDSCVAQASQGGLSVITVPEEQEVQAGSQSSFPIIISNQGSTAKTYVVSVTGVESWGESELSSAVAIVPAGETKTTFLTVQPDEDAQGQKVFMVSITSDEDTKTIPLTANVIGGNDVEGTSLKTGLEVALVVLVIILIIIGLIIGFNKLKGQEDEGTQTYY